MKLFHISEESGIRIFNPRPSPQIYQSIKDDVVFAVSGKLLHNYLLPRDCPRVTYYSNTYTKKEDKRKFFGGSKADYIVNVEEGWSKKITNAILYKYEFPVETFTILDETAGYYISYQSVIPVSETEIKDVLKEVCKNNVEIRFHKNLQKLGEEVKNSSLSFSIIRMRNAVL